MLWRGWRLSSSAIGILMRWTRKVRRIHITDLSRLYALSLVRNEFHSTSQCEIQSSSSCGRFLSDIVSPSFWRTSSLSYSKLTPKYFFGVNTSKTVPSVYKLMQCHSTHEYKEPLSLQIGFMWLELYRISRLFGRSILIKFHTRCNIFNKRCVSDNW